MDGVRFSTFPALLLGGAGGGGGAGREGTDLGQLAKAKVTPGATKTSEPESDPCCGFRPVVTRQAQTVCRWCSTADVGESGDAATFASWSSTGKTGRGEVGLAQGEEASAVQCCHLPACPVLAPGLGGRHFNAEGAASRSTVAPDLVLASGFQA